VEERRKAKAVEVRNVGFATGVAPESISGLMVDQVKRIQRKSKAVEVGEF
jgi:hypothetical protein